MGSSTGKDGSSPSIRNEMGPKTPLYRSRVPYMYAYGAQHLALHPRKIHSLLAAYSQTNVKRKQPPPDCFSCLFAVFCGRVFSDDDVVLPGTSSAYCGSDAFATGATVWASTNFVYGVTLECAAVTDTCYPPNYPTSTIAGASP